jgi:hypothetical protein
MVDKRRAYTPGIEGRLRGVILSGVDVTAYRVSARKLREVIRASPANAALKETFIEHLDRTIIRGAEHVSCMELGMEMAEFTEATQDEDILLISMDIKNLDKLPYTYANGKMVS